MRYESNWLHPQTIKGIVRANPSDGMDVRWSVDLNKGTIKIANPGYGGATIDEARNLANAILAAIDEAQIAAHEALDGAEA
jgi:hypothetical protein